ncbi:ComF family protein [Luteimonas sp. MC1895]|uniref:ComF family protein n=1 Tax=Luteimonas sp. MC1895 TaxID=2819513 RepID=UPI001F1E425D|nr:ComF family protein [Luteimonas sp. MC1895]
MPGPVNLARAAAVDGWLSRLGRRLWAPRCLVCTEPAPGRLDLCAHCEAALPWMPPACLSCAMPLPLLPLPLPPFVGAATAAIGRDTATAIAAVAAPTEGARTEAACTTHGDKAARPPAYPFSRLCSACQHDPPPLAEAHAAFLYGFPLDRLLPRLKFHRDLAAGRLLAQSMAVAFAQRSRPDALVPIPLHRQRLRERGYNQALELARPLGRMLGIPVRGDLLRRRRATAAQSRLDAGARAANLHDAFEVPGTRPVPAHVVLVDDVMTTGATLYAAADALLDAGADRVDAWVCARAP